MVGGWYLSEPSLASRTHHVCEPMVTQHSRTTGNPMTAQRLVENCVLMNQTAVVDEMLNKNLLPEEYIYPFLGDVMEWWLIDSWLAERLKREGEIIIEEYGCCWWGRLASGQAICMDRVIRKIAGE